VPITRQVIASRRSPDKPDMDHTWQRPGQTKIAICARLHKRLGWRSAEPPTTAHRLDDGQGRPPDTSAAGWSTGRWSS